MWNTKENRVFIVATDSKTLKKYKKKSSEIKLKGNTAATIVGAAGLLLGVGKLHAWSGFSLLIETFGDPYHLGLLEAQKLVAVLKDIFDFDIDLKKLEKEIKHVEKAEKIEHSEILKKLKKMGGESDTSYIG